jgi:flagellar biosynthesis protein FliR
MSLAEPLLATSQLQPLLNTYWWPFCRLLALFSMAPMFSHRALPPRPRVLLCLILAFSLGALLPSVPDIDPLSLQGLLVTLEQIAIGALLGLALQLVFVIFALVGEVISTQMGMSMARYNDPLNGVSSGAIVSQLYYILLVLLFFAIDGHLLSLSVLYQSFVHWPIGAGLQYHSFEALIYALGWVFSAALLITLPVMFCMILVQFCFGLLNRISPAMNLFSLGFPMVIMVGLLCILLTIPEAPNSYLHLTRELLQNISTLLRSTGHD